MAQSTIAAAGGTGSMNVTAASGCAWTAATNVNWITNISPSSGMGNGQVTFQVAPNPSPDPRSGQITLNSANVALAQSGATCQYGISPVTQLLDSGGGRGTIALTTKPECAWTARSNDAWLSITAGASGQGDGSVAFTAAANAGALRVGSLTIGDQVFTATQYGSCALSIDPATQTLAAGGGSGGPITISTSHGCSWSATTADNWITVGNPSSGTGSGSVTYSVTANTGAARSGSIVIGPRVFTVNQAGPGCTFTLDSTSASFSSAGGNGGPIKVMASSSACTWTTVSNVPWITVLTGATGTGNDTVTFQVGANATGSARTGTLTIAGLTFTITQS
jgi:hypothetical protein